ncbi:hypothetical protein B0T17DRAFT_511030 [Bombardia bombarda]|uniref:Uncharacterized protein n=1 Tax=Bombardia bombarda TaxID=252184 RepID=A0AA39WH26_9PEZI|nr:hypothetical protein B0T17DRAFT_511030 [Bombardia bombarda]
MHPRLSHRLLSAFTSILPPFRRRIHHQHRHPEHQQERLAVPSAKAIGFVTLAFIGVYPLFIASGGGDGPNISPLGPGGLGVLAPKERQRRERDWEKREKEEEKEAGRLRAPGMVCYRVWNCGTGGLSSLNAGK